MNNGAVIWAFMIAAFAIYVSPVAGIAVLVGSAMFVLAIVGLAGLLGWLSARLGPLFRRH